MEFRFARKTKRYDEPGEIHLWKQPSRALDFSSGIFPYFISAGPPPDLPTFRHHRSVNCPHCLKGMPENYDAGWCPLCGKDLPASEINSAKPPLRSVKIYWPVFFAVLLAPALVTMLSAMFDHAPNQSVSPAIGLFGGAAAGIACGIILGLRLGSTALERIVVTLLLCLVMAVVDITLSCLGCAVGGYNWKFH